MLMISGSYPPRNAETLNSLALVDVAGDGGDAVGGLVVLLDRPLGGELDRPDGDGCAVGVEPLEALGGGQDPGVVEPLLEGLLEAEHGVVVGDLDLEGERGRRAGDDRGVHGSSPSGEDRKLPQQQGLSLHHSSVEPLETLVGQPIRPVEFGDDRLSLVLKRLGDPAAWEPLEADLWHTHCDVYALPVERVRLDSPTSCGYHTVTEDGLRQLGHSKDHRPDLAQFKLMAAVAGPTGLFLAGDVHPGNAADDPLYLPLYRRARTMLGQTGLLYAGDCKMAALETRAAIAANQDFYLTRLP